MSISLNLVLYQTIGEKLSEENLKTVRCEEVSESLLEEIKREYPMIKREVYFDESLEGSFEIECFRSSDIDGICGLLEKIFLQCLSFENDRLNSKAPVNSSLKNESINVVADILSDESQSNPIELAVARFRILTGIISIFTDFRDKLRDDVGAVIKLG